MLVTVTCTTAYSPWAVWLRTLSPADLALVTEVTVNWNLPSRTGVPIPAALGGALVGRVLGLVAAVAGALAAGVPEGVLVPPAATPMMMTAISRPKAAPSAVRILCRRGQLFRGGTTGGC
jgi:hypothetical protein